jgi:hypothetical protein
LVLFKTIKVITKRKDGENEQTRGELVDLMTKGNMLSLGGVLTRKKGHCRRNWWNLNNVYNLVVIY